MRRKFNCHALDRGGSSEPRDALLVLALEEIVAGSEEVGQDGLGVADEGHIGADIGKAGSIASDRVQRLDRVLVRVESLP